MRITCPACSSAYEVPDSLLGTTPRRVRCARCGHEWVPVPPAPSAPEPPPVPAPPHLARPPEPPRAVAAQRLEPDFERLPPPPPESGRTGWGTLLAWVLTVLLLAAAGWALVAWRAPLMEAWPPSQRLYQALGLA